MDAIRTDQDIATCCETLTCPRDEVGFDLPPYVVAGHERAIDMNATGGSRLERVVQQALKPAAMDRDLRIGQARTTSARLVPHGKSLIRAIEEVVWCNAR